MKEYKQDFLSLRLLMDFEKVKMLEPVQLAYNVLILKGRKKSEYIIKAITHYQKSKTPEPIRSITADLKAMNIIATEYDIKTMDDFKRLVENKEDVERLRSMIPVLEVPRKMMCGFSKTNEEANEVFNTLFNMKATDRVAYVSKAIRVYIEDGYDLDYLRIQSRQYLLLIADAYLEASEEEKQTLLSSLQLIFESSKNIKTELSINRNLNDLSADIPITKETVSIFCDESDVEQFLR